MYCIPLKTWGRKSEKLSVRFVYFNVSLSLSKAVKISLEAGFKKITRLRQAQADNFLIQ
jgi:hypothetical protein